MIPKFIPRAQTFLLNPRLKYLTAYSIYHVWQSPRHFKLSMSKTEPQMLPPKPASLAALSTSMHSYFFHPVVWARPWQVLLTLAFLSQPMPNLSGYPVGSVLKLIQIPILVLTSLRALITLAWPPLSPR